MLVDEVYAGLEWHGPRAPSIAGMYARGITTGSVSKALGLQGLRTGWMICPDRGAIMDAVILRENSSEIMNILGEVIAEIALRPDRLAAALARARAEGRANLDRLDAFVAAEPSCQLGAPRGRADRAGAAAGRDRRSDAFARRLLAAALSHVPACPARPMTSPTTSGWGWGAGPRRGWIKALPGCRACWPTGTRAYCSIGSGVRRRPSKNAPSSSTCCTV